VSAAAFDEENRIHRGDTVELSDEESDWIKPPPTTSAKPFASGDGNMCIKGLDDTIEVETPAKNVTVPSTKKKTRRNPDITKELEPFPNVQNTDSFSNSFSLRIPMISSTIAADDPPNTLGLPADFFKLRPEELVASTDPFSNLETNPIITEFSWSWKDSELMKETGSIKDGTTKEDIRKRFASAEFEKQRAWEAKKFKKAGYDVKRYNRGDWGPKMGIFRL
jgi:ubiquitin-conjugating enzyme E2 S